MREHALCGRLPRTHLANIQIELLKLHRHEVGVVAVVERVVGGLGQAGVQWLLVVVVVVVLLGRYVVLLLGQGLGD